MIDDWHHSRTPSPYDESFFSAFILLHLYLYANAYDTADLVIDATALARDVNLRSSVEQELSEMVGSRVDLSDAYSNFELSVVDVQSHQSFIDSINQFTKIIAAYCRTEKSAQFIETMKNDALEEWQRHEFYAQKSRSFFTDKLAECEKDPEQEAESVES